MCLNQEAQQLAACQNTVKAAMLLTPIHDETLILQSAAAVTIGPGASGVLLTSQCFPKNILVMQISRLLLPPPLLPPLNPTNPISQHGHLLSLLTGHQTISQQRCFDLRPAAKLWQQLSSSSARVIYQLRRCLELLPCEV